MFFSKQHIFLHLVEAPYTIWDTSLIMNMWPGMKADGIEMKEFI